MILHDAIEMFIDHQKNRVREKTRESYGYLFRNLESLLGTVGLHDVSSQDLYEFLLLLTEGRSKTTARLRYAQRPMPRGARTSPTSPWRKAPVILSQ
jgi:hypothetical protein